jgi:hypothetical protein
MDNSEAQEILIKLYLKSLNYIIENDISACCWPQFQLGNAGVSMGISLLFKKSKPLDIVKTFSKKRPNCLALLHEKFGLEKEENQKEQS